jgi:hypothetical protein
MLWSLGQLPNYQQLSPKLYGALKDVRSDDALTVHWLRAIAFGRTPNRS